MSMDFARAALAERRPSFFLSLAPTTSSSYPQPDRRPSVTESQPRPRRASISSPTGLRVLKLSPVYYGEHIGQNQDDFYDVAAAAAPEMAPSSFLSLAPATSSSYPQMPSSRSAEIPERRRSSSSLSSTTGFRVLKLGPVYWGEHDGDHKEDFHDVPSSP